MSNELRESYLHTRYTVEGFVHPIRIGCLSAEADALLAANRLEGWAYITAYNPLSVALPLAENKKRNLELLNDVKRYIVIPGEGQGKDGAWPAEKSFFVAGITLDEAQQLAARYGQHAFVYGRLHRAAELVETMPI
ncbi:MAG: DUF3293 domain-containing protein [Saprospiraceae bacterium]